MNRKLFREITTEEIETYDRDGVVHLPGILDEEWVERIQTALDRTLDQPGPRGLDLNEPGAGRFAFDTFMWTRDPDFRALVFESPLAEMAAKVMQSPVAHLLWDFITVKEPNTPNPTDWHQDLAANPVKGPQCCGTWLSLDEVTLESGAVHYVRGSHRWGRYFTLSSKLDYYLHDGVEADKSNWGEVGFEDFPDFDELRKYYEKDLVYFDVKPGDVVMHQLLTIHGAPGNLTNQRRRAIAPRWVGQDAVFAARTNIGYTDSLIPPWDPGLKDGDRFPPDHHLYPQVWPEPLGIAAPQAAE